MTDLSEDIEHALADHYSTQGCVPTGFVIITSYIDEDGTRGWAFRASEEQGCIATLGLLDLGRTFAQADLREQLSQD